MDDLRKALFRALEKSDINMLRAVLSQGVSLAYEDGDPDPVCFVGAPYDGVYLEGLTFLHAAGADIYASELEYQDSLLHWCVNNDDEDLLPWLIAQGLDVNAVNSKGRTPLFFAAYTHGDETIHARAMRDVRRLVEAGADAGIIDNDGGTVLHNAAYAGALDLVDYLLATGCRADSLNGARQTPLHVIALRSDEDLHEGHLAIADLLLEAGADINALDEDGHPPLACTHYGPSVTMARKLIDRGANLNANNGAPLRMMMNDDSREILAMLIEGGASLDIAHGDERLSPIGLAANNNCLGGITALLDRGVDIEAENVDGETPLLIATWHGHHAAVDLLLTRGANRHHTDHYGNTTQSWAQRRKDMRLINMLSQ